MEPTINPIISYNVTDNFNRLLKKLLRSKLTSLDIKVIKFLKYLNENVKECPQPSELKMITRSTAAKIQIGNNSDKIFQEIYTLANLLYDDLVQKKKDDLLDNIIGLQYKELEYNYSKKKKQVKKQVKKNQFYNCFSIKMNALKDSTVNMKFFNNGSITMTGCKIEGSAQHVLEIMVKYIYRNINKFKNIKNLKKLKINNLRTTMINYNFKLNFNINRDKLYNLLKNNHDIFVSYEPEKYQAVKISFMYNDNNKYNDGVCYCKKRCSIKHKGWGQGEGDCKKITIAIFQSGNTGINGSRSYKQVVCAYKFITEIIKEYYKDIVRYSILEIDNYELKRTKKIRLKNI